MNSLYPLILTSGLYAVADDLFNVGTCLLPLSRESETTAELIYSRSVRFKEVQA